MGILETMFTDYLKREKARKNNDDVFLVISHHETQKEYTRHIKQCDMFMMVIAIGFFIAMAFVIVETFKYLGL